MDPLTLVGNILSVAKTLLGMSDQLKAAGQARRERIAELFARISDCLAGVSSSIRDGQIPHGRCAELISYAEDLPDLIKQDVGENKADQLGQALHSSYDVEMMAAKLEEEEEKEPLLAKLEEASGKFRALSNMIRVS